MPTWLAACGCRINGNKWLESFWPKQTNEIKKGLPLPVHVRRTVYGYNTFPPRGIFRPRHGTKKQYLLLVCTKSTKQRNLTIKTQLDR